MIYLPRSPLINLIQIYKKNITSNYLDAINLLRIGETESFSRSSVLISEDLGKGDP